MTIYRVTYKKYSSDTEDKVVFVVAASLHKLLDKMDSFLKKNWANRVVSVTEHIRNAELAK